MSYDLILRQALKLHDEGRLDEAERLYRQILETAPITRSCSTCWDWSPKAKGCTNRRYLFCPGR